MFGGCSRNIRRLFVALYGPLYVRMIQNRSGEILEADDCNKREKCVNRDQVDCFLGALFSIIHETEVKLSKIYTWNKDLVDKGSEPLCVGLDLNGEEDGNPFSPFLHSGILIMIGKFVRLNPLFGVRFHAGEAVVRGSSVEKDSAKEETVLNFLTHLQIVAEEIRLIASYIDKIKPQLSSQLDGTNIVNVRIGHGLAFLPFREGERFKDLSAVNNATFFYKQLEKSLENALDPVNAACFGESYSKKDLNCWIGLHSTLDAFRTWLVINKVVFEVNLTSNHTLLCDVFSTEIGGKTDMFLQSMLHNRFTVILSTDDDGIWPIQVCKRHKCHISVAKEYCKAMTLLVKEKIVKWHDLKNAIEQFHFEKNGEETIKVLNDVAWKELRKQLVAICEKNEQNKWFECCDAMSSIIKIDIQPKEFMERFVKFIHPSIDWDAIERLLNCLQHGPYNGAFFRPQN